MANPTIIQLPEPPKRSDAPANFTSKADAFVAALPQFVDQTNTTITWMGQQVTDTANSASSALKSSQDATSAKNAAANSASQALTYRDSAQAAAAAAQSSAGLPSLAGKAGYSLTVNADEQGVAWTPAGIAGFQEFSSAGVFNKPSGARFFYVEALGGASSGSLSLSGGNSDALAQGGIGGNFNCRLFRSSDLDSSIAVNVGPGGAAVTRTASSTAQYVQGNPGGETSFGSLLKASGGVSPSVGTAASQFGPPKDGDFRGGVSGVPANASLASAATGSSIKGGGPGASQSAGSSAVVNGFAGSSNDAGKGGEVGQPGVYPAGGGGATANRSATSGTFSSGAGATGRVRIWWW